MNPDNAIYPALDVAVWVTEPLLEGSSVWCRRVEYADGRTGWSLVVWRTTTDQWEWEILAESVDGYVVGDCATSCQAAIAAAEHAIDIQHTTQYPAASNYN